MRTRLEVPAFLIRKVFKTVAIASEGEQSGYSYAVAKHIGYVDMRSCYSIDNDDGGRLKNQTLENRALMIESLTEETHMETET